MLALVHGILGLIVGSRVLIVGDSLSHRGATSTPDQVEVLATDGTDRSSSPGDLLASRLLARGASAVRLDAKVGRSAWSFWRSEPAEALLRADLAWSPDVVVVILGTNDVGLNARQDEEAFGALRAWLGSKGAEVWAIGPPSFASAGRQQQAATVVDTMRRVFGRRFLDARPMTADLVVAGRTSDGVHFTSQGAHVWAARMADALTRARLWHTVRSVLVGAAAIVGVFVLSRR